MKFLAEITQVLIEVIFRSKSIAFKFRINDRVFHGLKITIICECFETPKSLRWCLIEKKRSIADFFRAGISSVSQLMRTNQFRLAKNLMYFKRYI